MESPPVESPPTVATISVAIPAVLRDRTSGHALVRVAGRTVRELIASLERDYPGLAFNLCYETGELRPYVNVFVNSDNVRYLQGLDTAIPTGATVRILQSVAGG